MKRLFFNALVCFLSISLLCTQVSAFSYATVGDVYYAECHTLAEGVTYKKLSAKKDDVAQQLYVVEYDAASDVVPCIAFGESIYGRKTLSDIVSGIKTDTGRVLAGINGDFFSYETGVPLSAVISEGRVLSSCSGLPVFGIREDGSTLLGSIGLSLELECKDGVINCGHLNKYPTQYGSYVQTREFGSSTRSSAPSLEIVIHITNGDFRIGGSVQGTVVAVREGVHDTEIPKGCFVISVDERYDDYEQFLSVSPLDIVRLNISAAEGWESVHSAIGGNEVLISGGQINANLKTNGDAAKAHPRSAIGVRGDGKIVLLAVDGRSGVSDGISVSDLAALMLEMGCADALLLDGGGSTTLTVYQNGDDAPRVVNKPSDGVERKISNAFLLLYENGKGGEYDHLSIRTGSECMLNGGAVMPFEVVAFDREGVELELPADVKISFDIDESFGYIKDGCFISKDKTGIAVIKYSCEIGKKTISGASFISIVDSFDEVDAAKNIYLKNGESAKVLLSGVWNTKTAALSVNGFTWSVLGAEGESEDELAQGVLCSCDIGYLSSEGIFYANEGIAERTEAVLIGKNGDIEVSVNITVGLYPVALFDLYGADFDPTSVFANPSNMIAVEGRFGSNAIAVDGDKLLYCEPLAIDGPVLGIGLWSISYGGEFFVEISDAEGNSFDVPYEEQKDLSSYNGYKMLYAEIPKEAVFPIKIKSLISSRSRNFVIVDHAFALCGEDEAAPFADMSGHWAAEYMRDVYEMELFGGVSSEEGCFFYPDRNLTRMEFAKLMVSYYHLDLEFYKNTDVGVSDFDGIAEWAKPYVRAAIGAGLMKGKMLPTGEVVFGAEDTITRAEVMYVFGTLLKDKIEDFDAAFGEKTPLEDSFSDAGSIDAWAREHIELAVWSGLVGGFDGLINPRGLITRSETAVLFSKTVVLFNGSMAGM